MQHSAPVPARNVVLILPLKRTGSFSCTLMGPKLFSLLLLILCIQRAAAQCTTLGQTPETAFPVCGSSVFTQTNVPICTNNIIYVPGCTGNGANYADTNPFWYKFTCFQSGTLGFSITPAVQGGDDYDWQLFDVTNRLPGDVYIDNSLFVGGNWSGSYAVTGASTAGTAVVECGSLPGQGVNTFSKMPSLIQGHNYLLLVSHYSPTQVGYKLAFNGGSAVITDLAEPKLKQATVNCPGTKIRVQLSKKMKCSSLAADGSDFVLSPALGAITSAVGNNCTTGFDMDMVELTLSAPLPTGNYAVKIKTGSDDNTLLDYCDNWIPEGDSLTFTVAPNKAVDMDSLAPVGCAPKTLQLIFKKNIQCNSVAANGSDFVITGTNPVTVAGASVQCSGGVGTVVNITLSSPIVLNGTYQIKLVQGTDGNTILDECSEQVPTGETLTFTTADTVSAVFNAQVKLGCVKDTIMLLHDGRNSVNTWQWVFEDGTNASLPGITRIYTDNGTKTARLVVSNGVCTDSSSQNFVLDNAIKARFNAPETICPQDVITFKDSSVGKITGWQWMFDNGSTSNLKDPPPQTYPFSTGEKLYTLRLVVNNGIPCYDTATRIVKVLYTCYINVPTAFTPNGDGINDYLYPTNALKATNLEFRVFNRYGQLVFETRDWTRKWDGKVNGVQQPTGVFVWYLSYADEDKGQKHFLKGTTILLR